MSSSVLYMSMSLDGFITGPDAVGASAAAASAFTIGSATEATGLRLPAVGAEW